jgi:hypothetical protein
MSTLHDSNGFCIPFSTDDQYIELELLDPNAGSPEGWPSWCDEFRWVPSDADFRPAPDDHYEPSAEDWQEWCEYLDRLDALMDLAGVDVLEDRAATLARIHAN